MEEKSTQLIVKKDIKPPLKKSEIIEAAAQVKYQQLHERAKESRMVLEAARKKSLKLMTRQVRRTSVFKPLCHSCGFTGEGAVEIRFTADKKDLPVELQDALEAERQAQNKIVYPRTIKDCREMVRKAMAQQVNTSDRIKSLTEDKDFVKLVHETIES